MVDGVLLSGRTAAGSLINPARFAVVNYRRGRGPRALRIGTPARQLVYGDLGQVLGVTRALLPGDAYRLYFRRRPSSRRTAAYIGRDCGAERQVSRARALRRVRGTGVKSGSGGMRWSARLQRGSGSLRCLDFGNPSTGKAECGFLRRRRSTLFGISRAIEPETTGIAVAARTLRSITVTRLTDRQQFRFRARRGVAVASLPGRPPEYALSVTAHYRGGGVKSFLGAASSVAQPGQTSYVTRFESAYPSRPGSRDCAVLDIPRLTFGQAIYLPGGACGDLRRTPAFFAVRHTSPADNENDYDETVVAGGFGPTVKRVAVLRRGAPQPVAVSSRGRVFMAQIPGNVPVRELTTSFTLADGTIRSYPGAASLALGPPPR